MLYDKDIREPLFDFLEEAYGKLRIIEEKQVGKSRADIVMVLPGLLTGIEIKSDADSYVRLSRQVKASLTAIWWWQVPATRPMSGNMFRDGGES